MTKEGAGFAMVASRNSGSGQWHPEIWDLGWWRLEIRDRLEIGDLSKFGIVPKFGIREWHLSFLLAYFILGTAAQNP